MKTEKPFGRSVSDDDVTTLQRARRVGIRQRHVLEGHRNARASERFGPIADLELHQIKGEFLWKRPAMPGIESRSVTDVRRSAQREVEFRPFRIATSPVTVKEFAPDIRCACRPRRDILTSINLDNTSLRKQSGTTSQWTSEASADDLSVYESALAKPPGSACNKLMLLMLK